MLEDLPILAIGRRKSSIAQVKIEKGSGQIFINGRAGIDYLQATSYHLSLIQEPFSLLKTEMNLPFEKVDTIVHVSGGGKTGQAQAIQLGISRACSLFLSKNEKGFSTRDLLKKKGYLTRDGRIKERKKYGLKKARKAPQYSKR